MSDDLGFNKIAGAVLATGLAIAGLNQLSAHIYEPEVATKPGYDGRRLVDRSAGGGPAVPDVPPDWGTVLADRRRGRRPGRPSPSARAATSPPTRIRHRPGTLNGVLGRKPGTHLAASPTPALRWSNSAAKQPIWDYEHVYEFGSKDRKKYIAGTKMTFAGLKKSEDRINLIAYLHTLGSSLPVPVSNPAAAARGGGSGRDQRARHQHPGDQCSRLRAGG